MIEEKNESRTGFVFLLSNVLDMNLTIEEIQSIIDNTPEEKLAQTLHESIFIKYLWVSIIPNIAM